MAWERCWQRERIRAREERGEVQLVERMLCFGINYGESLLLFVVIYCYLLLFVVVYCYILLFIIIYCNFLSYVVIDYCNILLFFVTYCLSLIIVHEQYNIVCNII